MENNKEVPQKLNIELKLEIKYRSYKYDPAIPLLGIHTKEMKSLSQRDIRTPMFIAALFIIART